MTNVPCYGPYKGKNQQRNKPDQISDRDNVKDNIKQQRPKTSVKDKMNYNNKDKVDNNNNKKTGYDNVKQEHRTNQSKRIMLWSLFNIGKIYEDTTMENTYSKTKGKNEGRDVDNAGDK